jgi:iron(III) transport system ATP-binding protein
VPLLEVKQIECGYRGEAVASDLSFHVNEGHIASLLGPSGCGKTTVLRAIAGFEPVFRGEILINGEIVSAPGRQLAPEKRHLGMVFQDYTLFPHMSIADNIGFGLRNLTQQKKNLLADEMLDIVGLRGYGKRYPHELSGGQQQRVALARALAPKPRLLLMDEPFSSLDVELRERLSIEVRDILKEQGTTGILVTHDQHEAFAMCEVVGVMHEGQIHQWDTPYNLYHEPVDRFVADFIGQGVFIPALVGAPDTLVSELGPMVGNRAYPWPQGTQVDVLVRPDDVVPADPPGELFAEVLHKAFKGAEILYTLKLSTGSNVLAMFPSHQDHSIGEQVPIRLAHDHLVAFEH